MSMYYKQKEDITTGEGPQHLFQQAKASKKGGKGCSRPPLKTTTCPSGKDRNVLLVFYTKAMKSIYNQQSNVRLDFSNIGKYNTLTHRLIFQTFENVIDFF